MRNQCYTNTGFLGAEADFKPETAVYNTQNQITSTNNVKKLSWTQKKKTI